jgi:type I restriction enzyme S subunit
VRQLPRGWTQCKLSDLISADGTFVDGDWVESKDQDPGGQVRLVQLADIGDSVFLDKSSRFLTSTKAAELHCTALKQGDILVARMPNPLGRACMFPGSTRPCVTVVDVCIIRPGGHGPHPLWLMHTINAPQTRAAIASLQSGSTRKRISRMNLGSIHIPVPPRQEQRRIVAEIEKHLDALTTADEAVRNTRLQIPNLTIATVRSAFAQAWFEPESRDRTAKWKWLALGDALESLRNGISAKPEAETGQPILKISAVRPMELRPEERRHLASGADYESYLLRSGDLLFTRYNGNPELVGACAAVPELEERLLYPDKLIRARLKPGYYPQYFEIALNHGASRRWLRSRVRTTAGQCGISGGDLKVMPVPVPSLEMQRSIADRIAAMVSKTRHLDSELAELSARAARLRQSILKKAFEGKLVPQDPNDEPASILLDRIRSTRAHPPARRTLRKREVHA